MDRLRPELSSSRVPWVIIRAGLAVALAAATGIAGCDAFGIHPSGNGAIIPLPAYPDGVACLGTCVPDPGSQPVDCTASSGVDTLPLATFDNVSATGDYVAQDLYTYSDGTAQTLYISGATSALTAGQSGYQPLAQESDLCREGNFSLHIIGGYIPGDRSLADAGCSPLPTEAAGFRGYGGGIGIAMQKLNSSPESVSTLFTGNSTNSPPNQDCYCNASCNAPNPSVCPPSSEEYPVRVAALDVSAYEGVSFWARRGPNGQEGIGVTVGDRYTDDDLSFLSYLHDPTAPRHCERVRQCACSNQKPCLFQSQGASDCFPTPMSYYCLPLDPLSFQSISGQGSNVYCDVTECNQPYAAYPNIMLDGTMGSALGGQDPAFYAKSCSPYAWTNGVGSDWCYDPTTDPPPADPTQQCGDHWMKMVPLDTDWHFYKIPFTDLRQQGFGKKSEQLDLHAVSVVRFTWTNGFIDYWLDDVSFYRAPQ